MEYKAMVILFYASWDRQSGNVEDILTEIEKDLIKPVKFLSVNVTQAPQMVEKYLINSVPTVLIMKNNKVKTSITMPFSKAKVMEEIKKVLRED